MKRLSSEKNLKLRKELDTQHENLIEDIANLIEDFKDNLEMGHSTARLTNSELEKRVEELFRMKQSLNSFVWD